MRYIPYKISGNATGWIAVAKRAGTRKRRVEESIALLEKGEKLDMK